MSVFLDMIRTVLILVGILLSPMWIGVISRIFIQKLPRKELAGLISLPFVVLLEFRKRNIDDLTGDILEWPMGPTPSFQSITFHLISLLIGIILVFLIVRGIAEGGIRIVDAIRNRKNKDWITV
ncbi:MAG: hypothetical protein AB7E95_02065 [Kiritimatiellales bacterium]